MMARSNEGGEKACTCVNVEKPRSSGDSKKSISNSLRLTSNNEAIYSAGHDGQIYIEVNKLNGWPVKVQRDTDVQG